MPSWSARLLSTGSASNSSTSHRATPQMQNGTPKPASNGIGPLETPLRSVTFLPSESSPTRISPTNVSPRHGRSISHPFPTLFGGGKRKNSKADIHTNGEDIDTGDDDVDHGMPLPPTPSQTAAAQDMDQLLVTGRCATCDALVRWPRHLEVYRCTVCLMINDLKPAVREIAEASSSNATPIADTIRRTRIPRKVLPLSLERTKRLIDQCTISLIKSIVGRAAEEVQVTETLRVGERPRSLSAPAHQIHREQDRTSKSGEDTGAQQHHHYQIVQYEAHGNYSLAQNCHASSITDGSIAPKSSAPNRAPIDCTRFPPSRAPPPPPIPRKSLPRSATAGTKKNAPTKTVAKYVFHPLETYLAACLSDCECLNGSFDIGRPSQPTRAASEASLLTEKSMRREAFQSSDAPLPGLDGKTLLLGSFAENGMWWTGSRRHFHKQGTQDTSNSTKFGEKKTPRIDWSAVVQWYNAIFTCGEAWRTLLQSLIDERKLSSVSPFEEEEISDLLAQGRLHLQRNFLKNIENLLRRPGRPVKTPEDCRFLLILLANPLLYPCHRLSQDDLSLGDTAFEVMNQVKNKSMESTLQIERTNSSENSYISRGGATGQHSGIIKRILGLMANLPSDCHQTLASWFRRFSDSQFRETVDLVGGFVSYRLSRQSGRKRSDNRKLRPELVPTISGLGAGTSAHLHAALGISRTPKASDAKDSIAVYNEDWQIKAAAKVMSLLFSANNSGRSTALEHKKNAERSTDQTNTVAGELLLKPGQKLPTNTFYNTLLDYADLIADFECWESRRGKFSFCQYPMFLSIWAKIHILEYDTRRQMEVKAREAFFNSILSRKAINQHLLLKVRRDCLVDDSLQGISEVVGTGQEEIKKGLRIQFVGEEGIDAGGLRKEWFLLLVREVFDPEHGLFIYDEESRYCYFNPNSFETSDQFYLVGVVLGLAIYNSTILDVALPPFAFRKLLASAPNYNGPVTSLTRVPVTYTLDDLAEWRPSLARGLRQLLEYDGDVQETYCREFIIDVDRYGQIGQVPLCTNGETRAVTNKNRQEFVDLYIRYFLDIAVVRQFEPFKRGFFTVCGGNALSLFRPEEIELLIRGSDEPLDVTSLRAVAMYEGWDLWAAGLNGEEDPVIGWFWDAFARVELKWQRKILGFITGSDRIPAMGATSLIIKLSCLGDNCERFPIARTCFNQLGLYRYRTRTELEGKLWRAISESEGFGLK